MRIDSLLPQKVATMLVFRVPLEFVSWMPVIELMKQPAKMKWPLESAAAPKMKLLLLHQTVPKVLGETPS